MAANRRMYLDEDSRLMMKAAKGDRRAYAELYWKYFSVVSRFVSSLDSGVQSAEDITQEVFTRVWQKRAGYTPDSTVRTYLFGYAKNILREERNRSVKAISSYSNYFRRTCLISSNGSSEVLSGFYPAESRGLFEQAMSQLSVTQRQAIELFYVAEKSLAEAAVHCNCSVKAFESRLIRARSKLRRVLRPSKVWVRK